MTQGNFACFQAEKPASGEYGDEESDRLLKMDPANFAHLVELRPGQE